MKLIHDVNTCLGFLEYTFFERSFTIVQFIIIMHYSKGLYE